MLGLTEERVAAGLGISTETLCDTSLRLWKTTFSAERDRIALKAQLAEALTDGDS
jgi:hypothetical protein